MKPNSRVTSKGILRTVLLILVVFGLTCLAWIAYPSLQPWLVQQGIDLPAFASQPQGVAAVSQAASPIRTETSMPTATASLNPGTSTNTVTPVSLENNPSAEANLRKEGLMILAMRDGNYVHLFAYHPLYLPLTRLTNNPWDDITPALSPDGAQVAYSSRQNGYWDLYVLDLKTGQKTRLTDTPDYEGSPSWSPDGQWIAYERYNGVSLDIYIQSLVDLSNGPIQLTEDPGIDRSPAWSPKGREIAFVSDRSGNEEIWLARLDNVDNRFINLSSSPLMGNRNPVWSADGQFLAWTSEKGGDRRLAVWGAAHPEISAKLLGEGDRMTWSPDGSILYSVVNDPNGTGIAGYEATTGRLNLPYARLPGAVYGLTWLKGPLPAWLQDTLHHPDQSPAPTLDAPVLTRTVLPAGRKGLVPLPDVTAPQPMLHDAVDEAFNALRNQVAAETGWDALSSLENAYVPLTSPSTPSFQDDWLYTGRAFSLNTLLLSAGWMTISREDFGGQTYWHVYLKARYQDGSMGLPLSGMVWDMNARFAGDPRAYEMGGKSGPAPSGYWIDLTELTQRYHWERLPSLINWRTFFPSVRFNEFVMTGGLEWHQAMAELYPPEALSTTTPQPTYTPTVTPTLKYTPKYTPRPITATPTPTLTQIPTRRPTWTPLPQQPAP